MKANFTQRRLENKVQRSIPQPYLQLDIFSRGRKGWPIDSCSRVGWEIIYQSILFVLVAFFHESINDSRTILTNTYRMQWYITLEYFIYSMSISKYDHHEYDKSTKRGENAEKKRAVKLGQSLKTDTCQTSN